MTDKAPEKIYIVPHKYLGTTRSATLVSTMSMIKEQEVEYVLKSSIDKKLEKAKMFYNKYKLNVEFDTGERPSKYESWQVIKQLIEAMEA